MYILTFVIYFNWPYTSSIYIKTYKIIGSVGNTLIDYIRLTLGTIYDIMDTLERNRSSYGIS